MSVSLITPDPAADEQRRRRLRRMRTLAVSLLLLAAVVYLLTLKQRGFLGYVNSGAEASMVGAIADWFAVTAIFKRPLGLPIPHTGLIPRRKDEFGRSLEDFVKENFLQEQVIRGRLTDSELSRRVASWLEEQENAERVVAEASSLVTIGLRRLPQDDVRTLVTEVLVPRMMQEPIAPVAGSLLAGIVDDGAHHALVDLVLEEGKRWLVHNQEAFVDIVGERAPWWTPQRVNDVVTHRLHIEAIRWVSEIRADPDHQARMALDSLLRQLAEDLQHDPATQERAERLKVRLLEQPQLVTSGMAIFETLR
ncbi:MAG: DUF445 domain-containing protein, partial [Actinomycetota bacterium]|nr:DUF445 domain-containing protein [Actinomycetota bacterium]